MLKMALGALLLGTVPLAFAQDQKPFVFGDPGAVIVGPEKLETDYTWAEGKWSDADEKFGPISTVIHCYRRFGFCEKAEASAEPNGKASTDLTTMDILRWDEHELIAVDSSPICEVDTVRFDFRSKQVTYTATSKGIAKNMSEFSKKICSSIKPTATAFLGGR